MKPDISKLLSDDSFETYLGRTDLSASGVIELLKSPYHYKCMLQGKLEKTETQSQSLGTLVHLLLLEPKAFDERYFHLNDASIVAQIGSAKPRSTTKYKEWLAIEYNKAEGKIMVSAEDVATALSMVNSIQKNNAAMQLLKNTFREQSMYGHVRGINCRIRPDALAEDGSYFVSIKTAQDASPEGFGRACGSFKYHVKESFYMKVLHSALPTPPETAYFIVVENKAPYVCQVYDMNPERADGGVSDFFLSGAHLVDVAIDRLVKMNKTGLAPAYECESETGEEILAIKLPSWEISKSNQTIN
jgi:exodeoxyribonuclease VIII